MTKPWEAYESTIKALYQQHTLTSVKQIMLEQYGFEASTRAYRQRLDKWGVTKYKTRRRSERAQDASHGELHSEDDSVSNPSSPIPPHLVPSGTTWATTSAPSMADVNTYAGPSTWSSSSHHDYHTSDAHHRHGGSSVSHGSDRTSGVDSSATYPYDYTNNWIPPMSHHGGYPSTMAHTTSGVHGDITYGSVPHHSASYPAVFYPNVNYHNDSMTHGDHPPFDPNNSHWNHNTDPDDGGP